MATCFSASGMKPSKRENLPSGDKVTVIKTQWQFLYPGTFGNAVTPAQLGQPNNQRIHVHFSGHFASLPPVPPDYLLRGVTLTGFSRQALAHLSLEQTSNLTVWELGIQFPTVHGGMNCCVSVLNTEEI